MRAVLELLERLPQAPAATDAEALAVFAFEDTLG